MRTPWGRVRIRRVTSQLTSIEADTDRGAAFGQGYVAGRARLWQLELTRRVATGTLAALVGPAAVATDRFQRDLGLVTLAAREARRDAGNEQAALVRAYVAGINRALDRARALPVELALLRHRPRPFTARDVYLVAQLKYFINSTWKFELLHTLLRGALDHARVDHLLATYPVDGAAQTRGALGGGAGVAGLCAGDGDPLPPLSPLPPELAGDAALARDAADAVAAGLDGLDRLGLSSPDIGSNAFAVSGSRTQSGAPLLAADPHMGLVNPGFNLLFQIATADGLRLMGAHFPGAPGIVVGCNQRVAWGMVGLMADNQDLLWGRIELPGALARRGAASSRAAARARVRVADAWLPLSETRTVIEVRGGADEEHVGYGFALGRLVCARGDWGLFFRWPALDSPLGSVALAALNRARDWPSFRRGLGRMHNAPMISVYADRTGNIGLQAVGLIPRRRAPVGSLVLSLDRPEDAWDGYVDADALPRQFNPPSGAIAYANQYERGLFDGVPHLSNRWHPPTRALRIRELLDARARHTPASMAAIQDDRVDGFARAALPWLLARVGAVGVGARILAGWDGDTRRVEPAQVFERWMEAIAHELLSAALPAALASAYPDQWPGHRWNLLAILSDHAAAWGYDDAGIRALLARTLARAAEPGPAPRVAYRHALRRHPVGRALFLASHRYDGGSRETVHVARKNVDFLTARQSSADVRAPYSFGPAFKLIYDLSPRGEVHYLSNTPTSGLPLGPALIPTLRRWRRGTRYQARV